MARYEKSRSLPIIITIIVVIAAIVALVSLTRAIFSPGQSTQVSDGDTSEVALLNSTVNRAVRMTVRGKIVANESFRSYIITVSPSSRAFVSYQGYDSAELARASFGNNIPAYENFVYALNRADFAKGDELTGEQNETRGVCATGRLYQFEILNGNQSVKSLWTSSCRDAAGSLDGNATQITSLFTAQIPDSRALIARIDL